MADAGGVLPAYRQGGLVNHLDMAGLLSPPSRRERVSSWIARRAWVGWNRRVGWVYGGGDVRRIPLISTGITDCQGEVFKQPDTLRWVRIPGTGWCLSTYRRGST